MPSLDVVLQGFGMRTNQGTLGFCSVTLIRGSRNILVDAAHVGRRELLLERLRERGLSPNDIDLVFITHAHWDHIFNIDLFPNAKFLIHPLEREYVKNPHAGDWATPRYTSLILESRQLQEVKEGEEIDDGISVLETPGHSRGSMSLLVRTDQGTVAVTGDALLNGWSATSGLPRLVFWNEAEAKASIRKILDRARTFYPGHDRPFSLENGRVRYLETTSIQIYGWPDTGLDEGGPALVYGPSEPVRTLLYVE